MKIYNEIVPEGYHTITSVERDIDCDHGPCTGYYIKELGVTVYLYEDRPDTLSFHLDDINERRTKP